MLVWEEMAMVLPLRVRFPVTARSGAELPGETRSKARVVLGLVARLGRVSVPPRVPLPALPGLRV